MPELTPDLTLFTVRCERHAGHFPDAYNPASHRWNAFYVHPIKWRLKLDACDPVTVTVTPPPPPNDPEAVTEPVEEVKIPANVAAYVWHVEEEEPGSGFHTVTEVDRGRHCDHFVGVRTRGRRRTRLRITLTVRFTDGSSARRTRRFHLKEFLVVSLGDSFASGQGNPDKAGKARFILPGLDEFVFDCPMKEEADWLEPGAHRSLASGPSFAANSIEFQTQAPDEHDVADLYATTFLSFASSGATIENLVDQPQHDWQRGSQIAEAKRALRGRRIDALIISVGGNDLGFSDELTALGLDRLNNVQQAAPDIKKALIALLLNGPLIHVRLPLLFTILRDPVTRSRIRGQIADGLQALPGRYRRLAKVVRDELDPGRVFFTTYPTGLFDTADGGFRACGIFSPPFVEGMSQADNDVIEEMGVKLNEKITQAVQELDTHPTVLLDVDRWHVVDGIAKSFAGRGYCASTRFFVQLGESCRTQGDIDGTMHPNARGHRAYAAHIEQALREHMLPFELGNRIRLLEVPEQVNFDTVVVGDSDAKTLTITNLGAFDERIEIAVHTARPFTWPGVSKVLKPGEAHSFSVVFDPGSADVHDAELEVRHDAPNSLRRCKLSGRGIDGPTTDPERPDIEVR
jgi:lysophospholipase L1-like esterase